MGEMREDPYAEESLSGRWFQFAQALRKRAWLVRTFTGMTAAVVVLGTWFQRPVYEATATVLIDMETPSVLAVSSSRDDATISQMNYFAYADYYRTQLEVMASRELAEQVFENLKLGKQPWYRRAKMPVMQLMSQIRIEPVKQTRLAKVHVEDRNPKQAAAIANELALVFTSENQNRATANEAMILAKTEYLELQRKEAEFSKRYKAKHPAIVRIQKEMEQLSKTIEEGPPAAGSKDPSAHLRLNNIRVQDMAQVPIKPVRPRRLLNLLLGLIFGGIGGVSLAVALELTDTSLKTPEDIGPGSKLLLLGHIPRIDGLPGGGAVEFHEHTRFSHVEPFSPAAEAYRSLRTALLYTAPMEKIRTLIFTSPGPQEGKTTTVSNLAAAVAQGGVRVLVIDADMRRGRLHDLVGVPRNPGLSEYLAGDATLEQIIRPTQVQNLWLIPCGRVPRYPAELVGTQKMRELMKRVGEGAYDRVFVDTPPVMAVTDGAIVAAIAKNVIAVVQSGRTPRQALSRLSKICEDVQAKVMGVVLNNVPAWSTPYYYRYSSYQYTPSRPIEKKLESP